MGRKKKRTDQSQLQQNEPAKKVKKEESYLVRKYRPERHYDAMDAFVKYTKSHRMLDASYVRWNHGETEEKPFVFCARVGGTDLGWGRGKTKEIAMDNACRAAFALVSAHGYKNFTLNDDCFAEGPIDLAPPMPHHGHYHGMLPPLPVGVAPPPPLPDGPPPAPQADLIPQPDVSHAVAPVATAVGGTTSTSDFTFKSPQRKELKGGLTLIYDPEEDGSGEELSMEERRAGLVRYQKMLSP